MARDQLMYTLSVQLWLVCYESGSGATAEATGYYFKMKSNIFMLIGQITTLVICPVNMSG